MNSRGSCRGSTFKVRRFGRYARNCPSEIAVNGPMRMTSDSVGSPPGCTIVARYFATWPLAVISRWISSHKRSSSAAVGVARERRELPQPFVARKLAGRRRELRRDQRLLQDRGVVVRGLAGQAEQLRQSERGGLVAQLRVQVVDPQLVRRVGVREAVRRRVELSALLLRGTQQRVLLGLRRLAVVLGDASLEGPVLARPVRSRRALSKASCEAA